MVSPPSSESAFSSVVLIVEFVTPMLLRIVSKKRQMLKEQRARYRTGYSSGSNFATEAVANEFGDTANVVDMPMRRNKERYRSRIIRKLLPVIFFSIVPPLREATVY